MGEAAEEEGEDQGQRHGLENRPAGAEDALLVADLQLPLGQEVEELPVLPDLAEVNTGPAARWANVDRVSAWFGAKLASPSPNTKRPRE